MGGRFSASRHAVIDQGPAGGVPFSVVVDDAALLSALERGGGAGREEAIVGVAADLRSPAGCWRGKEPLMTVVLHRFTGRADAVLAVSRAHAILDGVGYCGFIVAWAREARGEAVASGTIDPPQPERRAGVPSRPWGPGYSHSHVWRLRRAEALRAEDAAFCSALRDQCTGSCRLLVTPVPDPNPPPLTLTPTPTLTLTLLLTLGRALINPARCAAPSGDATGRDSPLLTLQPSAYP